MTTRGDNLTGPEASEPQVPAMLGGIVPATPSSSSYVGLSKVLPTSTAEETAIVEDRGRRKSASGSCRGDSPQVKPGPKSAKEKALDKSREETLQRRAERREQERKSKRQRDPPHLFSSSDRSGGSSMEEMLDRSRSTIGEVPDDILDEDLSMGVGGSDPSTLREKSQQRAEEVHLEQESREPPRPTTSRAGETAEELPPRDGEEELSAASNQTKSETSSKRGRGRPPTTGKFVGVGKMREHERQKRALLKHLEQEKEERKLQRDPARMDKSLSKSVELNLLENPSEGSNRALIRVTRADPMRQTAKELGQSIDNAMGSVMEIAQKSGNLKGQFIRDLKDAAQEAKTAGIELHRRVVEAGDAAGLTAENAQLRLQNEYLQREILQMRATVEALKKSMETLATSTPRDLSPVRPQVPEREAENPPEVEMEAPPADPSPRSQRGKRRRKGSDEEQEPFVMPSAPPPKRVASRQRQEIREVAVASTSSGKGGKPQEDAPDKDLDPFSRIEALLERRLEAFRREILAEDAPRQGKGVRAEKPKTSPPVQEKRATELQPAAKSAAKKKRKKKKGAATTSQAAPSSSKPQGKEASLAPKPTPPAAAEEVWSTVVGRKAKRAAAKTAAAAKTSAPPKGVKDAKKGEGARPKVKLPRTPTSSAVTLTIPEGCEWTLDRAIAKLKAEIDLRAVRPFARRELSPGHSCWRSSEKEARIRRRGWPSLWRPPCEGRASKSPDPSNAWRCA